MITTISGNKMRRQKKKYERESIRSTLFGPAHHFFDISTVGLASCIILLLLLLCERASATTYTPPYATLAVVL